MKLQEEIENKTVNLMISTSKLSAKSILKAAQMYLRHRERVASQGKQSVKHLLHQNRGVTSIDIDKTGIRGFERYAKKYGIDYAIRKDRTVTPPKYLVFFKAQDTDALNAAFKEYSASLLHKAEKSSVLLHLHDLLQKVAELPSTVRHKEKERDL